MLLAAWRALSAQEYVSLGRWCHRASPRYAACDPMRKVDLNNADHSSTAPPPLPERGAPDADDPVQQAIFLHFLHTP